MTRDEIFQFLRASNARASAGELTIYVNALWEYREAEKNIAKLGSVVVHPRTGAPMENPFADVLSRASATVLKLSKAIRCPDELWRIADLETSEVPVVTRIPLPVCAPTTEVAATPRPRARGRG